MKRLLILFFVSGFFVSNAQEMGTTSNEETDLSTETILKPVSGEKTLELQFAPFGDNSESLFGIKYRKFGPSGNAFRLTTNFQWLIDSEVTQPEGQGLAELKDVNSLVFISIKPGFENHFKGTERMSPYFGMEFDLAYQYTKLKSDVQAGSVVRTDKYVNQDGFLRVGVNFLFGFDYYFSKKVYVGSEVGFGLGYTYKLPLIFKSDQSGLDIDEAQNRGNAFALGTVFQGQLRFGYVF